MIKRILSVISGVGAAFIVIALAEQLTMRLYPLPVGTDIHNHEQLNRLMAQMPFEAFLLVLAGYAAGAFAGGITATLVSNDKRSLYAVITGIVLMLAGIVNLCELYHPLWFVVVNLFCYMPFAYLGYLVSPKKQAEAVDNAT